MLIQRVGRRRSASAMALCLVALLMLQLPTGGASERNAPENAGPRGSDQEPNNYYNNASEISVNETVEGSLLISQSDDYGDYYRVVEKLPFEKFLCVTLEMLDYDDLEPGKYHFAMRIQDEAYLAQSEASSTDKIKRGVYYQLVSKKPLLVYVHIAVIMDQGQPTSQPGRYRLSLSMQDVPVYTSGQVSGYINNVTGPLEAWYKLATPPADGKGITATLQCPTTGNFNLEVYILWALDGQKHLLNQSYIVNQFGGSRIASVIGYNGTYYIRIFAYHGYLYSGYGIYQLSVGPGPAASDANNFPSEAMLINTNVPQGPFTIEQGVDWLDWYQVDMRAGKPLPSAYFNRDTAHSTVPFNFSAFDKDLTLITGSNGTMVDLKEITVAYDGPVYFAARVEKYAHDTQPDIYFPGRGSYKITMTFNNLPPRLIDTLPPITMDEDNSDSGLMLSEHFEDPDGDSLNFTLIGSGYHTRPVVDRSSGRVTFTPEPNWSGEEKVRFQAKDDGPGTKTAECNATVTVLPVNDPPYVLASIQDVVIEEGKTWQSPSAGDLFADIDDPLDNLGFACRVVGSDSHPPGSQLPFKYDSQNRQIVVGPARLMFGEFTLELNCTDRHAGTVPAMIRFNLTVTHVNHDPARNTSLTDPVKISLLEGEVGHQVPLDGLFTDQDLPLDYAADVLTFTFTGAVKLDATIQGGNMLVLGAGKEELQPGMPLTETLTVTATDTAGKTAAVKLAVTVEPVNDPPAIQAFQPVTDAVTINEGTILSFSATVLDPDTETAGITYAWYLDGTKDTRSKGSTFAYVPSFDTGDSTHVIRLVVSDGEFNTSMQWNITVKNVNRPPSGSITAPANFTKYKKGAFVSFTATGTDPDGDNLTYIWRDERGVELGRGAVFSTDKLPTGTQKIKLEISDGKTTFIQEVTVLISAPAPPAKSPGFGVEAVFLVLGLCLLVLIRRRNP